MGFYLQQGGQRTHREMSASCWMRTRWQSWFEIQGPPGANRAVACDLRLRVSFLQRDLYVLQRCMESEHPLLARRRVKPNLYWRKCGRGMIFHVYVSHEFM